MATLEKIRKKGPLVAVVIGLALLLFILGDIFRSGSALFQGGQTTVAEVAGESIDVRDYFNRIQEVENIYKNQGRLDAQGSEMVRTEVWNEMISNVIFSKEMEALGLSVEHKGYKGISPEEVTDMVNGKNIDPMIQNIFTNRQTGVFNPADVTSFLRQNNASTNPEAFAQWRQIEQELLKKRINEKYYNLVIKGLFTTSFEAKKAVNEATAKASIVYISKSINAVADSAVTVSKEDMEKYYDEHKYLFEQEVSRDAAYVSFNIVPSVEDSALAIEDINEINKEFRNAADAFEYGRMNSDLTVSKDFITAANLGSPLDTSLFNMEIGSFFGPYFDQSYWKVSKLIETKEVFDSLKASHILIAKNQQTGDMTQAKAIADSLKQVIANGADFALIALTNSQDQASAQKGGDLGWFSEGMMVPSFNEAVLKGEINQIQVIETDFGVHLVKVTDRRNKVKKAQIVSVARYLDASEKTRNLLYQQASKFAIESSDYEKFNENITKYQYKKLVARNILPGATRFAAIENANVLVKSIYNTEKSKIVVNTSENSNPVFEEGESYIVAFVTEIKDKGFASFENVQLQIETEVRKQKKTEKLAQEFAMAGTGSLETLANKLNVEVKAANDVVFSAFQIPGIGIEPKLNGVIFALEPQKVSPVIKGNTGVFMVNVIAKEQADESMFGAELSKLNRDLESRIAYQIFPALEKKAEIKDYRYKF
jgi:peptidyl-prolyl cis-trans isomerase D